MISIFAVIIFVYIFGLYVRKAIRGDGTPALTEISAALWLIAFMMLFLVLK